MSRGLVMYESLIKEEPASHLFIFCFDDNCHKVLKGMNLDSATLVSLKEFENADLLSIKNTRTVAEYCWTCTPSTVDYVLKKYDVAACTYIDADLYFYASPSILIDEMPPGYSVLITEHRYSPAYDQTKLSGIYCVQFLTFKNNPDAIKVLEWWRDACIDWCYGRAEDGKFGDQKYLDDWTKRYNGIVWELKHLGGGVAPWNVQQYIFKKSEGKIYGTVNKSGREFRLIFYHFHALSFRKVVALLFTKKIIDYSAGYELSENCISYIYKLYVKKLLAKEVVLNRKYNIPVNYSSVVRLDLFKVFKHKLKAS